MSSTTCVLAYSGGLDTSAIVYWLRDAGYEVHCVLVDVGQQEDLHALCEKALRFGAASAVIRDVRPAMLATVVPTVIALSSVYEGQYRLGTALARPFIAQAQVERARELGGATLVHGATGKGNDQVRFEFAYRTLAPECPILAPWKCWPFSGREDLVGYLRSRGCQDDFEITKTHSLDENLWHLSIEGGDLEDPTASLDVASILGQFADRFHVRGPEADVPSSGEVTITYQRGCPTAIDGRKLELGALIAELNGRYRHADWAWDLVIENRFTGVKSRGIYINPAAVLLQAGADAIARCVLNKPAYDAYRQEGRRYAELLYRGEYFSMQRRTVEAAAHVLTSGLTGSVTIDTSSRPVVTSIQAPGALFKRELATFEESSFDHADAAGFIALSWLSSVGHTESAEIHDNVVEEKHRPASDVCALQPESPGGLVPAQA